MGTTLTYGMCMFFYMPKSDFQSWWVPIKAINILHSARLFVPQLGVFLWAWFSVLLMMGFSSTRKYSLRGL